MRLAIIAIIVLLAAKGTAAQSAHDTTVTDSLFSAIRMSDLRAVKTALAQRGGRECQKRRGRHAADVCGRLFDR